MKSYALEMGESPTLRRIGVQEEKKIHPIQKMGKTVASTSQELERLN